MATPSVPTEERYAKVCETCQEWNEFFAQRIFSEEHTPLFLNRMAEIEANSWLLQDQMSGEVSEAAKDKILEAFQNIFSTFAFLRAVDDLDRQICTASRRIDVLYLQNPDCRDVAWRLRRELNDASTKLLCSKDEAFVKDLLPKYTRDSLVRQLEAE